MIGNKSVLVAALVFASFATQAAETVYTFDSVTAIKHRIYQVSITGVLVNDSTPTTVTLPWNDGLNPQARCERLFNVVLSQPATYRLTVVTDVVTQPDPIGNPTQVVVFVGCEATAQP